MFDKLEQVERRFDLVEQQLADPALATDPGRLKQLSKEHAEMAEVVAAYRERKQAGEELEELEAMSADSDSEIREMALAEARELKQKLEQLDSRLEFLLIPKDPLDKRGALLEIRAGTGGDEAALFAGDLLRMYQRYCEQHDFKIETMELSPAGKGGVKEAILMLSGKDAYGVFKFEGGVHRVQRVPETETQGRIHTSAVTVAVLPEAEDVDVQLVETELRYDVYRSSGPGGQSVNTTDSAVRITHIPSGLVVICQDEKSQHKNKAKARKVLQSRLFDLEQKKHHDAIAADRKSMVGSGDRSERIRTYNFPQGRITDHRIGLTLYSLDSFISGDMDEVLSALRANAQAEALKAEQGAP